MFNDKYGLTDAVQQGRKTMTRRICKEYATKEIILAKDVESWLYSPDEDIVEFVMENGEIKVSKPPYKIGDVVAVAQSYKSIHEEMMNGDYCKYIYDTYRWAEVDNKKGWNNKMFVLADLMPHQIRITDIKVERLQDISDEDIMKEGITYIAGGGYGVRFGGNYNVFALNPIVAFAVLIDKVSGKGTWGSNPYVFAYTFELCKK